MYQNSQKQMFGVITFRATRGGIAVERTEPATGEKSAIRMAERLASGHAGAVAVSRVGDPEFGVFDDPIVLASFGRVPADLSEMLST